MCELIKQNYDNSALGWSSKDHQAWFNTQLHKARNLLVPSNFSKTAHPIESKLAGCIAEDPRKYLLSDNSEVEIFWHAKKRKNYVVPLKVRVPTRELDADPSTSISWWSSGQVSQHCGHAWKWALSMVNHRLKWQCKLYWPVFNWIIIK